MREEVLEKLRIFRIYNDIALKREIVIYGSTYTANFPFYELAQKYRFSNAVYNRSIPGLTLAEAEEGLGDSVLSLHPSRVILSLGEQDLQTPDALQIYERILCRLCQNLPDAAIYVLSVPDNRADSFNKVLAELCVGRVIFLSIGQEAAQSCGSVFRRLVPFFRKHRISFADAFQTCV